MSWLQNTGGKRLHLVVPPARRSTRDEVDQLRGSDQYTVGNISEPLTSRWWNPWADLPKTRQSLTRAMPEAMPPRPRRRT